MSDERLRGIHLADQCEAACEAAVEEVRDHYAAEVRVLWQNIRAGTMTRQAAITHLTERYQLTRVGAADLLDRS